MIKEYLPTFVEKYNVDFVIANGENATHGKGLSRNHYFELIDAGVDVITLGNHYLSKNEIVRYIDKVDCLVRPLNLLHEFGGEGSALFDVNGIPVRVTNLLGSAFMTESVNAPYLSMLDLLSEQEEDCIHIIDYHAEATGEKCSFAYAMDGKVTAVLGTHTHIQTNDARVLPNGTAFISDVGMSGFYDGVLGFTKETVVPKIVYGESGKMQTPDDGNGVLSAVVMKIDDNTFKCINIKTIKYVESEHEN
ncbi:MAG: TIGR00282 family metallophosphoesterase [Bacilli bacterium]|nr:TIGR00282 family metallophosphoesterase [Bacilli bacterium]